MQFNKIVRYRMQWQRMICTLIVAALALGVASYLQVGEGYWIVLSALLGFAFCTHFVFRYEAAAFVSIALIGASCVFIASVLAKQVFLLALFFMLTTWLTVYIGLMYANVWGLGFAVNLLAILAAGVVVDHMATVQRFWCVLLGFLLAFIVQYIFIRVRSQAVMRLMLANSLYRLAQLSRAIFSCYLSHNYVEEHFNHEKKLHIKRGRYLYDIEHARQLLSRFKGEQHEKFSRLIGLIERSYEMLQAINLLLYRVDDHSTFAVADKELLAISSSVVSEFDLLAEQLQNKDMVSGRSTLLHENIYEMEEINRSALQVVAKEPLVFMIFIQDMLGLDKLMTKLSDVILELTSS